MNAMTFDVEEYYHVHAFAGVIDPATWGERPSRVVEPTLRILDMLGDVRATFFILGDVAARHRTLAHRIAAGGHEIASHGFGHRRVDAMSEAEFRADVRRAKRLLEDQTGVAVTAYRAPSFSITPATPWAHRVLVEEGHTVDSSAAAGRSGRSAEPVTARPYPIATPAGRLTEFPLPAVGGVPVGGGGYLRLFPYFVTRAALRSLREPFCVYLHPWELDPDQPRVRAPWLQNLRHRVGLRSTSDKLSRLLRDFRFTSMSETLAAIQCGSQLQAA
jgi:polysaccharide deacetylase family protein (PEP-CTERM system associated)